MSHKEDSSNVRNWRHGFKFQLTNGENTEYEFHSWSNADSRARHMAVDFSREVVAIVCDHISEDYRHIFFNTSSKVWDAVGDAISKGEHLKKIRICNMHFIADYSYRLFQKVRTYNCPIVELILDRNTDNSCGSYLVPFIKSITPTLKILSINNSSIHDETMVSISEALSQSKVL